jgi:hypothetical protein
MLSADMLSQFCPVVSHFVSDLADVFAYFAGDELEVV